MSRYTEAASGDEEFEPGSNRRVLRNRLGITDPTEIGLVDWAFDEETAKKREEYFDALGRGFLLEFKPLEALVAQALDRALRLKPGPMDER